MDGDSDMDVDLETSHGCSSFYTFVEGYDGDSDEDDDSMDHSDSEDLENNSSSVTSLPMPQLQSELIVTTPSSGMTIRHCSADSNDMERKDLVNVKEPIVSSSSCATTVTSALALQNVSFTSTTACTGIVSNQNMPLSTCIDSIQTAPLDLTVTSRANQNTTNAPTSAPLRFISPLPSVSKMYVKVNNTETSTSSNTTDPRRLSHLPNDDVKSSDKDHAALSPLIRSANLTCCVGSVTQRNHPQKSMTDASGPKFNSVNSPRKSTPNVGSVLGDKTFMPCLVNQTDRHTPSLFKNDTRVDSQHEKKECLGPQDTNDELLNNCSTTKSKSKENESQRSFTSKATTVTSTVLSRGLLVCSSLPTQTNLTHRIENELKATNEKELVRTPEKSKHVDKHSYSPPKLIPIEDQQIVDFSSFIWSSITKDCHHLHLGVSGIFKTLSDRKILQFSKPTQISPSQPFPSPLYKTCFSVNPNDPRTMVSSKHAHSHSNDQKSQNGKVSSSPKVEGLFSRILSFSDHSSSSNARSESSCDGSFFATLDKGETFSASISTQTEPSKTETRKCKTSPSMSLFEMLCSQYVDVSSSSIVCSKSHSSSKTSLKDNQYEHKELKASKIEKSTGNRQKSKDRLSKSNNKNFGYKNSYDSTSSITANARSMSSQVTSNKRSDKVLVHNDNKRKCLGLQKPILPRSQNTSKSAKSDNKMASNYKQERHYGYQKTDDIKNEHRNIQLPHNINDKGRRYVMKDCKEDERNVLDYHLCSLCMLDQTVSNLKPPVAQKKSSNCLKCTKKLNPKDLMCKDCKQCFPNMMTYAGHVYNLVSFHPSHKARKDFICTKCSRIFPQRFLFHQHLALSNCTRVCLSCDKIFRSRQILKEHVCGGKRICPWQS